MPPKKSVVSPHIVADAAPARAIDPTQLASQVEQLREVQPNLSKDRATQLLHSYAYDTEAAVKALKSGEGASVLDEWSSVKGKPKKKAKKAAAEAPPAAPVVGPQTNGKSRPNLKAKAAERHELRPSADSNVPAAGRVKSAGTGPKTSMQAAGGPSLRELERLEFEKLGIAASDSGMRKFDITQLMAAQNGKSVPPAALPNIGLGVNLSNPLSSLPPTVVPGPIGPPRTTAQPVASAASMPPEVLDVVKSLDKLQEMMQAKWSEAQSQASNELTAIKQAVAQREATVMAWIHSGFHEEHALLQKRKTLLFSVSNSLTQAQSAAELGMGDSSMIQDLHSRIALFQTFAQADVAKWSQKRFEGNSQTVVTAVNMFGAVTNLGAQTAAAAPGPSARLMSGGSTSATNPEPQQQRSRKPRSNKSKATN